MAKKPSALSKLNQTYPRPEKTMQSKSPESPKAFSHAVNTKKKPLRPSSPLNKINASSDQAQVVQHSLSENTYLPLTEKENCLPEASHVEEIDATVIDKQLEEKKGSKQPKKKKKNRNRLLIDKCSDEDEASEVSAKESHHLDEDHINDAGNQAFDNASLNAENPIDYDKLEQRLSEDDELLSKKERKAESRNVIVNKVCTALMVLACVYLIFLIYGALNTSYIYNKDGKVVAQKMSVEQIRALHDFEKIANEYRQARTVYEAALKLDYRIAAGIEDPLLIAPEYEKLLEKINKLAIQCKAVSVSTQYIQLHTMLNIWITTDIAVYCQNMSAAISRNDEKAASQALEYKTMAYNDFSVITANIAAMGEQIDGADIKDITDWSPEKFINEQIGGIGGELG